MTYVFSYALSRLGKQRKYLRRKPIFIANSTACKLRVDEGAILPQSGLVCVYKLEIAADDRGTHPEGGRAPSRHVDPAPEPHRTWRNQTEARDRGVRSAVARHAMARAQAGRYREQPGRPSPCRGCAIGERHFHSRPAMVYAGAARAASAHVRAHAGGLAPRRQGPGIHPAWVPNCGLRRGRRRGLAAVAQKGACL